MTQILLLFLLSLPRAAVDISYGTPVGDAERVLRSSSSLDFCIFPIILPSFKLGLSAGLVSHSSSRESDYRISEKTIGFYTEYTPGVVKGKLAVFISPQLDYMAKRTQDAVETGKCWLLRGGISFNVLKISFIELAIKLEYMYRPGKVTNFSNFLFGTHITL